MLTRTGMVHWISGLFRTRAKTRLRERRPTPAPFRAWVDALEARALLSGSPTIPFTINAPTAVADQGIYVAMFGSVDSPVTNSDSLAFQYNIEWDASGNAAMVPNGGSVEVEKLNFTPNAQKPGTSSCTINIPDIPNGNGDLSIASNTYQLNGARLVFGIGHSPYLSVDSNGGVAAPAPSSLNDPNTAQNYDFVEFTLDQAGMHINTSTVDQFGFPITVSASPVTSIAAGSNGQTLSTTPFSMSVASTAGFASTGTVQVMISGQVETINYTGKNDSLNQFTGCTSTGTGKLQTGQTVWSVSTYITSDGVGVKLDRQDVFNGFAATIGSSSPFINSLVDGNTVSAGSIYLPMPASGFLNVHSGTGQVTIQVFNVSPNDPALKVNFGTTSVSPTSATYDPNSKVTTLKVIPPSLTNTTVDVTVTSTGGTSPMYPNLDYYVFGTGGTPTVTGLSATTGPLTGGNMVIINGSNFRDPNTVGANCQVLFGSTPAAFTVLSSTAIQAYVPAAATAGPVTITVQNNNQTATNTPTFTYIDQLPVVTGLSPNNGGTGTTITVTGQNFVAGQTTVQFGPWAGTNVKVLNPTTLTVTVPSGGHNTKDVTVTTPKGTSPLTFDDRFTFPSLPVYSATSSLRLVNPSDILSIESNPPVAQYAKCEPGGQLANGTTYSYVVTATSNTGESIASNVQSAEANGIPGYKSIALAWTPFLNATGYNIYRMTNGSTGWYEFLDHVNAGQSSKFLDDGSATPDPSRVPPKNIYTFDPLASYFDTALTTFFNHYAPTSAGGDGATFNLTYGSVTFTGTTVTDGTGTYLSISGSDSTTCKIYRPLFNTNTNNSSYPAPPAGIAKPDETPGQMVFSGDGVFALNTGAHSGDLENVIVAAFNRGIATDFSLSPDDWGDSPADFYQAGSTANFYAAYMHQANVSISDARPSSIGGPQPLAYGFSYDDQAGNGGSGYGSYFTTPAAPQTPTGQPVPNGTFGITINFGSWTPPSGSEHSGGSTVNGDSLTPPVRQLARPTGLAGYYYVNGELAEVLQNGNVLTLVDGDGNTSPGTIANATDITAPGFGLTGLFNRTDGTITFSDGSVWSKVRQIEGQWTTSNNRVAGISQLGTDLTFTGGSGSTSAGHFVSATSVVATDWGNITGTLSEDGLRLLWNNGTVWSLVPDFQGNWSTSNGTRTRIEQQGTTLEFINRSGDTSIGKVLNGTQVQTGANWGSLLGNIVGNSIHFTNGTIWSIPAPSTKYPDLGGLWQDTAGQDTRVLEAHSALTFINAMGQTSPGEFVSATEVHAVTWNLNGHLSGNRIFWDNGAVWTRMPTIAGAWFDQANKETGINQLDQELTFTNAAGVVTHGTLVDPMHIIETDGRHRAAMLIGNTILWSDSSAWTKLPELSGNWSVASAIASPTYVEQSGNRLLFIDPSANRLRGAFDSPTHARLINEDVPGSPVVGAGIPNDQWINFDSGSDWNKNPSNLLDDVFANPNFWPFV